mmetsp:Transcript_33489/g.78176  ORF Transcript_33489/g.78176 Transcript_33489/m.78176 type:complete len:293 (+) Transcript_33489:1581-2459(+)
MQHARGVASLLLVARLLHARLAHLLLLLLLLRHSRLHPGLHAHPRGHGAPLLVLARHLEGRVEAVGHSRSAPVEILLLLHPWWHGHHAAHAVRIALHRGLLAVDGLGHRAVNRGQRGASVGRAVLRHKVGVHERDNLLALVDVWQVRGRALSAQLHVLEAEGRVLLCLVLEVPHLALEDRPLLLLLPALLLSNRHLLLQLRDAERLVPDLHHTLLLLLLEELAHPALHHLEGALGLEALHLLHLLFLLELEYLLLEQLQPPLLWARCPRQPPNDRHRRGTGGRRLGIGGRRL